jgi:hypothetical protein
MSKNINFLVKYLVVELYEKIFRIKKFIKTAYDEEKRESDRQLKELYDKALLFLENEINNFCMNLPEAEDAGSAFDNMLFISNSYNAIINIHKDLKNISSISVLPETKTFIYEIDILEKKLNEINLILTDNYSFKERNLGKKLFNDLSNSFGKQPDIDSTHSFILPKIEFSNPLNWSILVHEYGHLVATDKIDIFIEMLLDTGIKLKPLEEKMMRNWAEEMYCDVFAAKIIGPAYLISLLSFCLLNSFDCSKHSESHPSVFLRAENIKSFLRRNNADFSNDESIENFGIILNDLMINVDALCNEYKSDYQDFPIHKTLILRVFRDFIKKQNIEISPINSNKNIATLEQLISNLTNDIPIGSIKKQFINDDDYKKLELKKIKELSVERPTTHWEMLNTGWIYKIQNIEDNGFEIFFNDFDENVEHKIDKYGYYIDKLDEYLLHSISTSQIIKSIENIDGIIG